MPDEQICPCFGQRVKVHEALPGQMHKLLMLLTCRLIQRYRQLKDVLIEVTRIVLTASLRQSDKLSEDIAVQNHRQVPRLRRTGDRRHAAAR